MFGVWTQYVDLTSWQGQRFCDALFFQASGFAGFGALNYLISVIRSELTDTYFQTEF